VILLLFLSHSQTCSTQDLVLPNLFQGIRPLF
jgi:hypothetical protein